MTRTLKVVVVFTLVAFAPFGRTQSPNIPPAITTLDKLEPRLGTIEFKDGMPSEGTRSDQMLSPQLVHFRWGSSVFFSRLPFL